MFLISLILGAVISVVMYYVTPKTMEVWEEFMQAIDFYLDDYPLYMKWRPYSMRTTVGVILAILAIVDLTLTVAIVIGYYIGYKIWPGLPFVKQAEEE